nr:hypothetical protein [Tanacetum cinerariifolium]
MNQQVSSHTNDYDSNPNDQHTKPKLSISVSTLVGILPVSKFPSRFNVASTAILPMEAGMGPDILFKERSRSKCIKDVMFDKDVGMDPVSLLSARFSTVKRVMKGLSECKASESNIRRIRVKDIVKKVKDYLKTYSSAGMDTSREQHQTYSSQRHRQGSQRLLEDILVRWDGYQLVCRRNALRWEPQYRLKARQKVI